jgi:collagen type I/II/III/V/XI/XXIV/XXVII alpha
MAATVLSFAPRVLEQRGWTNEELAELYRVEHALAQAGIVVETDHGVTDEGDPWFVFCRPGGEVISP